MIPFLVISKKIFRFLDASIKWRIGMEQRFSVTHFLFSWHSSVPRRNHISASSVINHHAIMTTYMARDLLNKSNKNCVRLNKSCAAHRTLVARARCRLFGESLGQHYSDPIRHFCTLSDRLTNDTLVPGLGMFVFRVWENLRWTRHSLFCTVLGSMRTVYRPWLEAARWKGDKGNSCYRSLTLVRKGS